MSTVSTEVSKAWHPKMWTRNKSDLVRERTMVKAGREEKRERDRDKIEKGYVRWPMYTLKNII